MQATFSRLDIHRASAVHFTMDPSACCKSMNGAKSRKSHCNSKGLIHSKISHLWPGADYMRLDDVLCLECRAAAAPFLGNFTVGSQNYKWLIFGDDDTVFLIDNVLKLVNEMDHKVPYFMTDHIWFPEREGTTPDHSAGFGRPYDPLSAKCNLNSKRLLNGQCTPA